MKQVIHNNNYDVKILNKITRIIYTEIQNEIKTETKMDQIYIRCTTNKIHYQVAKISNLKSSFKADNTIGKFLAHNKNTKLN
jgi:hypothetical protein